MSCKNSALVSLLSKAPVKSDVVVTELCFCTPRMLMHKWRASITTATPNGCNASLMASLIWVVSLSWT